MLEIAHRLEQQIAQMPVPHKWTAELMKLPQTEADNAEHRLAMWLEEQEKQMFPEMSQGDLYAVERIVRHTVFLLLESEAIAAWLEKNPDYLTSLLMVDDPMWAAQVGAQDVMYVQPEQVKMAAQVLEKLNNEELKPDLQTLMQR